MKSAIKVGTRLQWNEFERGQFGDCSQMELLNKLLFNVGC